MFDYYKCSGDTPHRHSRSRFVTLVHKSWYAKIALWFIKDKLWSSRVTCKYSSKVVLISCSRASSIIWRIGFDHSVVVEAEGFVGGIWIHWDGQAFRCGDSCED